MVQGRPRWKSGSEETGEGVEAAVVEVPDGVTAGVGVKGATGVVVGSAICCSYIVGLTSIFSPLLFLGENLVSRKLSFSSGAARSYGLQL